MTEPTIARMVEHSFNSCEYDQCTRRATKAYGGIPTCEAHFLAMARECRPYTIAMRAEYDETMATASAQSKAEAAEIAAREEARPTRSLLPLGRKRRPLLPFVFDAAPTTPPVAVVAPAPSPPPAPKPMPPPIPILTRLSTVSEVPKVRGRVYTKAPKPPTVSDRLLVAVTARQAMTSEQAAEVLGESIHSVIPAASALRSKGLIHPRIDVRGAPGFGRLYLPGQAPADSGRWRVMFGATPNQSACRVAGCNNKKATRGVCQGCRESMPKDIYEDVALPSAQTGPRRIATYGKAILAYVRENPGTTAKAAGEALNIGKVAAGSAVADLRKAGLLMPAITLRHDPNYGKLFPSNVKKGAK